MKRPLCLFGLITLLAAIGGFFISAAPSMMPVAAAQTTTCALPNFRNTGVTQNEDYQATTAGDFNGDGFTDLAFGNEADKRITVYLGNGTGAFTRGQSGNVMVAPRWLRTGDHDGDGKLDLYCIGYNAAVQQDQLFVWKGIGDGTFTLQALLPVTALPERVTDGTLQMEVADFNSDGRSDVFYRKTSGENRYRVFLIGGGGTFFTFTATGVLTANSSTAIGDVNLDGTPDIVVAQHDPGKLQLLVGIGNGTFRAPLDLFTTQSRITSIATGDFNRAGRRDFVITTGARNGGAATEAAADSFKVMAVLSNGMSGYTTRSVANVGNDWRIVRLADLNGEGRLDVLLANAAEPEVVRGLALNNGAGDLCPAVAYSNVLSGSLFVDVNRDNRADVITNEAGRFGVLLNQTNGGSALPPTITLLPERPIAQGSTLSNVLIAQVNDNVTPGERLRLAAVVVPGGLTVTGLTLQGTNLLATITASCTIPVGRTSFTVRVTNEAGLISAAEVQLVVTPGAAPTFRNSLAPITLQEGIPAFLGVSPVPSAPVNGTTYQLFYDTGANSNATVRVLFDGVALPGNQFSGGGGTLHYLLPVTAGTHTLRVVVGNTCGEIVQEQTVTVRGAANDCVYPAFAPARNYEATNAGLMTLAAGDFNGDRRADVAVVDTTANQIKIYLGQANGELLASGTVATRRAVVSILAADFTRDGKLDLAVSNYDPTNQPAANERGVSVFAGVGNGTFTLNRNYDIGHGYLAQGDLNKDGSPDLIVTEWLNQMADRRMRILLNNGSGVFTEAAQPSYLSANAVGLRPVVAFINADDNLDVLTTGLFPSARPLYQFNGNGMGQLQGVSSQLPGQEQFGDFVHAADFGGDGRLDAAVSFGRGDGAPQLNDNSFALYTGETMQYRVRNFKPQKLVTADFNGDGNVDVAFETGHILLTGTPGPYCAMPRLLSGTAFKDLATGDFDGDGKLDVIATGAGGGLQLLLNRLNSLTTVSAANFSGAVLAPEQIVAGFGANLATSTAQATTTPLPTTLGGTQVRVRDSAGVERLAPLFFVTTGQVNFLIPAGTANGTALIQITSSNGNFAAGSVLIANVAAGLFTVTSNGRGFAAAQVLRGLANGTVRYEEMVRFNTMTNQWAALPIDVSNTAERVFLVMYATGLRGRAATSPVTATVGGVSAEVQYAGRQGSLVGVDQINLRLPATLAGRGEVEILITVDGKLVNPARVVIR